MRVKPHLFLIALLIAGCPKRATVPGDGGNPSDDGGLENDAGAEDAGLGDGGDGGVILPPSLLTAVLVSSRFNVAEDMRTSVEMQLSGEPFAELLGYDLGGFTRTLPLTDQYTDPATGMTRTDPLGYGLGVESYEYSKQPMNNLSFESGAGLSLMYGPVLNPTQVAGDVGYGLLVDRFQNFASQSHSGGAPGKDLIVSPAPIANPLNYYGWPGLWPVFAEFSSFEPTIRPAPGAVNSCTFGGSIGAFGYGGIGLHGGPLIANYECDYNSLNLLNRDGQVTKTLEPDALGYATWKQGLWSITYWGTLHDLADNAITYVAPADMEEAGQPLNTIIGGFPDPTDPSGATLAFGAPGVYLGDIPMEGWQGLTMMDEIDNKSGFVLTSMTSRDGTTLQGAPSIAAAIDYSYDSPLLYFPASIAVIETPTTSDPALATKYFPQPTSLTIANSDSHLSGLSGLLGGFSEAFAFTDHNNAAVGGSIPFLVTFDGDPFPADNGLPDGENTLHDRALGILKIALVNADRLHFDPTAKVLVDTSHVASGAIQRGTQVTTVGVTEAIIALRTSFRTLNGSLLLYSNDTPDTLGSPSSLDAAALSGAPYSGTLQSHITELIRAEADFLSNQLIQSDGTVANGFDLATGTADPSPTTLEAETSAIRGLLEAYLATSVQQYRTLAITLYADLGQRFWVDDLRLYRTKAGDDALFQYTPLRFGTLQGALRQYYKLVASSPSRQAEGDELLQRIKRSFKLVANGWDDRNQDDSIQYPDECLGVGLQLGERALTGELGHPFDKGDRDKDCVREISYVYLPAALGSEVDLIRK